MYGCVLQNILFVFEWNHSQLSVVLIKSGSQLVYSHTNLALIRLNDFKIWDATQKISKS